MSLKSFHLLFIFITACFSIFLGYWSYSEWTQVGNSKYLFYIALSAGLLIAALLYGKWFSKEVAQINAG
ncbi:MAG: hypothetical protein QF472_07650 [Candidatus Marinimicrobia bacterium]|nr:hypothetical protein [Candidatus Neomarinimicrobiota bacterium]